MYLFDYKYIIVVGGYIHPPINVGTCYMLPIGSADLYALQREAIKKE